MYRLKKQIDYAKFTENSIVTLDIDYAERLLLKLTEQYESLTLEEVKKEWKKLGYKWIKSNSYIYLSTNLDELYANKEIRISLYTKQYYKVSGLLNLQEHQLLTKTFKALGWFDE